jgi:hypothetical protein
MLFSFEAYFDPYERGVGASAPGELPFQGSVSRHQQLVETLR